MTNFRRAAQVVEDLKTLGILRGDEVTCQYIPKKGGLVVIIDVTKEDNYNEYHLVKEAFTLEFSSDVKFYECSVCLRISFN